jgi:hypothetical protein
LKEVDAMYFDGIPNLTVGEFSEEPQKLVAIVSAMRQRESLNAAILLAEGGLGHLGVMHVRPACDEYLWLSYLSSLDASDARDVVLALRSEEISRSLNDQYVHLGEELMIRIGFPRQFVRSLDRMAASARDSVEQLSTRLRWSSKPTSRAPTIAWIAQASNNEELYKFLYSATSRMLHFSPFEAIRRGWSDLDSSDGQINLESPIYINYRTCFALHWLPYFLLHTLTTPLVIKVIEDAGSEGVGHQSGDENHRLVAREWASLGPVPIIIPEELNFHHWHRKP